MKKKKPSIAKLFVALGSVVLFSGIALGSSFALFTSKKEVSNKLTVASGIKASLYLTELRQDVLDEDGTIKNVNKDLSTYGDAYSTDTKEVDLSKVTASLFTGDIVPSMKGSAKLKLVNEGDIAFTYSVNTTETAKKGTEDVSDTLKEYLSWSVTYDSEALTVKKNESKEITISYTFSSDASNDAQGLEYSLDLSIECQQVTSTD